MLSAIILALLIPDSWQEAMQPSGTEVQAAMSARWVMISSIGDDNRDYAVRDLLCGKSEPFIEPPEPEGTKNPVDQSGGITASIEYQHRDIPQFTVRCSFEAASVARNSRKARPLEFGKRMPRIFSKRALKRIPAYAWQKEAHEFIYIARGYCRLMGRTPKQGECHYWSINYNVNVSNDRTTLE